MAARINNGWEFFDSLLNRLPGWPSEKQLVMLTTFAMGFIMLVMARNDAALWNVELFKTLITVVIVTGCINMILAFYFTANKSEEARVAMDERHADTTAKALDAIRAVSGGSDTIREGDTVTLEKS